MLTPNHLFPVTTHNPSGNDDEQLFVDKGAVKKTWVAWFIFKWSFTVTLLRSWNRIILTHDWSVEVFSKICWSSHLTRCPGWPKCFGSTFGSTTSVVLAIYFDHRSIFFRFPKLESCRVSSPRFSSSKDSLFFDPENSKKQKKSKLTKIFRICLFNWDWVETNIDTKYHLTTSQALCGGVWRTEEQPSFHDTGRCSGTSMWLVQRGLYLWDANHP